MAFQNALQQIPEVEQISLNSMPPVAWGRVSLTMKFHNGKEEIEHEFHLKDGDTSYISMYDIKLLAGRNLLPIDSAREFLINETFMHHLGFSEPRDVVGKTLGKNHTIVGVVRDFHTQSLHAPITPTAISYDNKSTGFAIKVHTPHNKVSDMKPALAKIEAAWNTVYADRKFKYSFLDEQTKRFYENEQRTGKLARAATGIAVLISCLGLFGLSSFTVLQRTKEIGIRKVLGATVKNIWFLLSKDFVILILVACIVSAPVAYYVAESWLENFAYRMDITAWIFITAALVSLIVAFITLSFRTVRAAQANPVKSLRYE